MVEGIADPLCLLASVAAACCVYFLSLILSYLATWHVKMLLALVLGNWQWTSSNGPKHQWTFRHGTAILNVENWLHRCCQRRQYFNLIFLDL